MNYPYDQIENELIKFDWKIKKRNVFKSPGMWFVKEIWELKKYNSTKLLNFLIDPQNENKENLLWAISFTENTPKSRKEAEKGELIPLDKNLIINLKIKIRNWL